jgi:hypothetical protein
VEKSGEGEGEEYLVEGLFPVEGLDEDVAAAEQADVVADRHRLDLEDGSRKDSVAHIYNPTLSASGQLCGCSASSSSATTYTKATAVVNMSAVFLFLSLCAESALRTTTLSLSRYPPLKLIN